MRPGKEWGRKRALEWDWRMELTPDELAIIEAAERLLQQGRRGRRIALVCYRQVGPAAVEAAPREAPFPHAGRLAGALGGESRTAFPEPPDAAPEEEEA